MRKKPASLSAPARRKEDCSLFKESGEGCKGKISPQLLLATQRFLSQGEGDWWACACSLAPCLVGQGPSGQSLSAPVPSKLETVRESRCCSLQPCQQRHSRTLGSPEEWLLFARWPRARARLMPPVVSCGLWPVPGPLVVGKGLGPWASGVGVVTQAALGLADTAPLLCHGQRWTCSAPCESLRQSCCTC